MKRELTAAEKAERSDFWELVRALAGTAIFALIAGAMLGLAIAPSTLPMFRFACMPEYRDGPVMNLNWGR